MTDEIRTNFGRKLPSKEKSKAQQRREGGFAIARARGQVTPDELEKGKTYIIPSFLDEYRYTIESVGRKWIKARRWHETDHPSRAQPWKRLKSGWDGPYFLEVTVASAEAPGT